MIEFVGAAVLLSGLLASVRGMSEKKKIEICFKNLGFGVKEGQNMKYPVFKRKIEEDDYTEYHYRTPLGLTVPKTLGEVLWKTLGKHVEAKGEGYLNLKVYRKGIPDRWKYENIEGEGAKWEVPIGKSYKGTIWHDFDKIPHMTVAGTTRYGKTVLLKGMVTSLIENNPEDVEIYIIDLKGGLEFGRYAQLRQVKGLATDGVSALEMLEEVLICMAMDMQTFRSNYITNITDSGLNSRKFIIVDEGAQLTPDKFMSKKEKDVLGRCQAYLSELSRLGGGLGYRVIFCTQYPTSDTLPRQIKMNADAKISFKLGTGYASEVALDEYGAEKLEKVGRCIYKTADRIECQVPLIEDKDMWKRLEGHVDVSRRKEVGALRQDIIEFEENEDN